MPSSSEQRLTATGENTEGTTSFPRGFVDGLEIPDFVSIGAMGGFLEADPFTGAAQGLLPLRLSPGRGGFGPALDLHYDSRRGNGHFGLGWSLCIPSVDRSTRAGMPRHVEEDIFEIVDDELVPSLRSSGGWMDDRFTLGDYVIHRYKRRFESCFERIERWVHQPTGQTHWRVVDPQNVTSLFGTSDESRVSDPGDARRVSRWLLAERFDDKGNVIRYVYKQENLQGVDLESRSQSHRRDRPNERGGERYLKRVLYGNAAPHDRGPWHFEVVFDYGEHDSTHPSPDEVAEWNVRADAFVQHRPGFEVATWRRCERVLMFHHFDELSDRPVLVSSTSLAYDDGPTRSCLVSATHAGHVCKEGRVVQTRELPRVTFDYAAEAPELAADEINSGQLAAALVDQDAAPRWTDFYQEGLPGVLTKDGEEWRFLRNLGNARFAAPEAVPYEDDTPVDLTKTDIVETALAHERSYRPTTVMRGTTGRSHDEQHVGYLDLNGDSADDVVVADQRVVRWYPSQGEDGFADPVVLRLDDSGRVPSRRMLATPQQSFHLADMTGDGLYDLVRVRNEDVCYWPGLGHGRFGEMISMDDSPAIGDEAAGQVLLADLTGTGTSDLLVVGDGELRVWKNRAGSRFCTVQTVRAPGLGRQSQVTTVDLFGSGCEAAVWVDKTGGESRVRYLASRAGTPAGALVQVDNGMGVRQRLAYVPSTDLWRRDRDAKREWFFTSPVPIHVVERAETRDVVARTRHMQRFVFRNAAYEADEGRFIGFATSEAWHGGLPEDYALPGLFADEAVPDFADYRRSPFKVDRRWFHTGSMVDGGDLTEELVAEFHTDSTSGRHRWLTGHQLPAGQDPRTLAETHRALRGRMLRHEVAEGRSGMPLQVTEKTAHVRQVQPARSGRPQCLDVHGYECVTVRYDAAGGDPRIEHEVVLNVDDFGFATRSVKIAYARRQPDNEDQTHDRLLLTENEWAHGSTHATWYRLGIPLQRAVHALEAPSRNDAQLFDVKSIRKAVEASTGSIVSKRRHIYWTNDSRSLLAPGRVESRALLGRTEELAFEPGTIEKAVDDPEISDLMRMEGGYQPDEAGWWAPGETTTYDPAHFYVEVSKRRAVGDETRIAYDGSFLFKVSEQDVFGNVTRYKWNTRTLQWWKRLDPNAVSTTRRFDPLGFVLSVTRSADGSGDSFGPGMEASGRDNPTAVVTYRFPGKGRPGWWRVRHRLRHEVMPPPLFDYTHTFDGHGRRVAVGTRSGVGKWRVSDIVERNGSGAVVATGSAFFSDTPLVDEVLREQSLGQGRRFAMDLFGRLTRIDEPLGLIQTFQYTPWSEVHHDVSDNVLDSAWYAQRQGSAHMRAGDIGTGRAALHVFEARSAVMAAVHAQTPTTRALDPWGRVVAERRKLTPTSTVEVRYHRDPAGRVVSVIDAKGREARTRLVDLMGRVYRQEALDSVSTVTLRAASGEVLRSRLASGEVVRHRYDAAGRCTHTFVSVNEDHEVLVERTIWGGGETSVPDATKAHLVGVPHIRAGSGGIETIDQCDLNGNVTRRSLWPATSQSHPLDWSLVEEVAHSAQVIERLRGDAALVADEPETIECRYDALSNLVSKRNGNIMLGFRYGAQARLDGARVLTRGSSKRQTVLDEVRYDATGNLAAAALGSKVRMRRRYDVAGRVVQLAAASAASERRLQDRHLVYSPDGNVNCINDRGELSASYTYDALGRLTRAEGFEPGGDAGVRRFTNAYMLDEMGNVLSIEHSATGKQWERLFSYADSSNRVLAASRPDQGTDAIAASYTYDEMGNVVSGPNSAAFVWDHCGRLVSASRGDVQINYAYDREGALLRRRVERPGGVIEEMLRWQGVLRCRRWKDGELTLDSRHQEVSVSKNPVVVLGGAEDGELDIRNVITDHLGSVMLETDADGKPLVEWEFLPYGLKWSRTQGHAGDSGAVRAHDFRDGWFDEDTELLFVDKRWYSPWLGRFVGVSDTSFDELDPYVIDGANPQRIRSR